MTDSSGEREERRLRILVAEDNEFTAELMLQQITRRGHDAIVIGRGDDVLGRIEKGGVDLLLLDLHLPGLDGFQVIEQLRARERITGRHLPVIALTARSSAADRQRCLDSGMDDFIPKPAKPAVLWAVVDRLLRATPSASPKPAPSASLAWLEPSVLLSACGGDPAVLAKINRALQSQLPAELARAAACLEASNAPALRESAHKLCGMIAVVSTSGGNEASALEEFAACGALQEAAASFASVKALTETLLVGLSSLSIGDLQARAKAPIDDGIS
jgi:two-component system sensor histidine kinase/response regulator